MKIAIVVAVADNSVIGKTGSTMLWHIPEDLQHFRTLTLGGTVIMGRKTYESIGHALPDRQNIILSRNPSYAVSDALVVGSLEAALEQSESGTVFVIGGGEVFAQALPKADVVYLTRVHLNPEGDVQFVYDASKWQQQEQQNYTSAEGIDYSFVMLMRDSN